MNRSHATILLILLTISLRAQDSLSSELIKRYAYTFEVKSGKPQGQGWDSLRNAIAQSQFVLLGENHSSPKLSELLAAALPEIGKVGFRHFIIETGPVASQKVRALYNKDPDIYTRDLHDFLSKYKLKAGTPPAEFIAMKADVAMYKAAIENGFSVQGIDKEYFSSYRYLFDELIKHGRQRDMDMYKLAMSRLHEYDSTSVADKTFSRISHIRNDDVIGAYVTKFGRVNTATKQITKELENSWTVYGLYESKKYYESEETRIHLLKENLGRYYAEQSAREKTPKMFIKYGNVHTERGESSLGHFDLGNALSELAALNGTRSLHIMNMRRYRYNANDEVMDFLSLGYEVYPHVMEMVDKEKWTVIDLGPLRKMINTGKLKAPAAERTLILKNDWLLLTPVDIAYAKANNYE